MAATHFAETIENLVTAQQLVDEMEGILHKQSSVFEVQLPTAMCTPCFSTMAIASAKFSLDKLSASACQCGVRSLTMMLSSPLAGNKRSNFNSIIAARAMAELCSHCTL